MIAPRKSYIVPEVRTKESIVDTTKWKSVLVPVDVYQEIRRMAHAEGRTLSGQLKQIYRESEYLRREFPNEASAVKLAASFNE